jgi:hypothetical protein
VCSAVAVPGRIPVDRIIPARDAVYHFTFVRSEFWLRNKFASWGHALHRDWHPEIQKWLRAKKNPYFAVIRSQFERGPLRRALKFTQIPPAVEKLIAISRADETPAPAAAFAGAGPVGFANSAKNVAGAS